MGSPRANVPWHNPRRQAHLALLLVLLCPNPMSPPWGSEALLEALAHWQRSHLVLLLLVFSLIDPVAGSAVSHPLHLPAIVQLGLWGLGGCLQGKGRCGCRAACMGWGTVHVTRHREMLPSKSQRGCLQVGRVPMQRLAGAASVTA